MHILQYLYLKGTINKSICRNKRNRFIGYSDSDFASDEKNKKIPLAVFIFLLGDSPISWKSQQLKKRVTLSKTEAEFISLTECAKTRYLV